jgi:ankyrin repeat protein
VNPQLRATRDVLTALPAHSDTLQDVLAFQVERLERAPAEVASMLPTRGDAHHVIACEHYFADWNAAQVERTIDREFETAADAICDGDLDVLADLLAARPDLARARSAYGHRATLLHHVAANGIEVCRQWQSPMNAPDIARALLAAGAEPDARADMYGDDTPLGLVLSSCHPAEAGVQPALIDALVDGGADLDEGGGMPMWTAIVWGYERAVDRLVARGARIDNLVFAACANDLERVSALLAAPNLPATLFRRPLESAHALEYALIYAAGLGRRDAVELLLTHGPDLAFREPIYNNTALDAASYPHPAAGRPHGNPEITALLAR